jgi:hypothetical protein
MVVETGMAMEDSKSPEVTIFWVDVVSTNDSTAQDEFLRDS